MPRSTAVSVRKRAYAGEPIERVWGKIYWGSMEAVMYHTAPSDTIHPSGILPPVSQHLFGIPPQTIRSRLIGYISYKLGCPWDHGRVGQGKSTFDVLQGVVDI